MDLNSIFSKIDNQGKGAREREWKPTPKLIPIIEKAVVEYNEKRKQDSPTMFRASGIGGCDRQWAFKEFGHKETISANSYLIMNVGTAIHELLQAYLAEHFISLEERLYFNEKAGDSSPNDILSGSYDGELDGKILGQKKNVLLEIKTTGVENFQRLIKNQSKLSNKYKLQNNVYLHAKGLDATVFIFFNRNLQFTNEFMRENKDDLDKYNPVFFEMIYRKEDDKVQLIRDKISARKLAKELKKLPPYEKLGECDYCPFGSSGNDLCKTEKNIEKAEIKAVKAEQKAEADLLKKKKKKADK